MQGKARARADASWNDTPIDGPPTIAIVDDHRIVSSMLIHMLESAGYAAVDAFRPDPEAIVEVLTSVRPRLTFLDHELGSAGSGIGLVEAARRHGVAVALTASDDRLIHAWYLEAGADGVISKTHGPAEILATVELALAGERVTTDAMRQQLLTELRMARSAFRRRLRSFDSLTEREAETLEALCNGDVAATIAESWVVSLATVRSHIRSILMKLDVSSQLEAVARAHQSGWLAARRGESPIVMMTHGEDLHTMASDERKSVG